MAISAPAIFSMPSGAADPQTTVLIQIPVVDQVEEVVVGEDHVQVQQVRGQEKETELAKRDGRDCVCLEI